MKKIKNKDVFKITFKRRKDCSLECEIKKSSPSNTDKHQMIQGLIVIAKELDNDLIEASKEGEKRIIV